MAAKLFSAELEKRALRGFCTPNKATRILSNITTEHFATEVCKAAFNRVRLILNKRGSLMSWRDLITDPTLPAATKAALKAFKFKAPTTEERNRRLFDSLDAYRQLRGLNTMSRSISEALNRDDKQDVASLLETVARSYAQITAKAGSMELIHEGIDDNSKELIERILKGEKDAFLRTGFRAFDDRAHGIPWGSLMMVAAPTGGGKSALVRKLAENFALQGVRVLSATLEMDQLSNMQRSLASLTGVNLSRLVNPINLTKLEKEAIRKKQKARSARIRKAGGKLSNLANDSENLSLDTILTFAKTMHYRVVVIDYMGLLDGADGDDQVRALSRMTRKAKLWAGANNAVVVFAAQLADDGSKVRYAGAMKEHSSNLWQFVRSPLDKENKTARIQQTKSRKNEEFDFDLFFDTSVMDVRDLTPEEVKRLQAVQQAGVYGGGGSGKGNGKKDKNRIGKIKKSGFSSKYSTDIT